MSIARCDLTKLDAHKNPNKSFAAVTETQTKAVLSVSIPRDFVTTVSLLDATHLRHYEVNNEVLAYDIDHSSYVVQYIEPV